MNIIRKIFGITSKLIKREINYWSVRPANLLLFLTYRCSSRCNSCRMWQREITQPELSADKWKVLIDMAVGLGVKNLEMFGGDALLKKWTLLELIKYAKRRKTSVDFTTNCILMDEDTAKSIIESGIDVIYISVDGIDDTYQQARGLNAFEKVKRGIEYLLKARAGGRIPEIIMNCTVSSLNVDSFEQVFSFAEEMGVDAMAFEYAGEFPARSLGASRINGIEPQPYYTAQESSILVNQEQARLLKNKLKELKNNSRKSKVRLITKNIDILKTNDLTSGRFPNKKCYVCRYMISADPYGNILPCPFYNNYHLGNIRTAPLDMIWKNQRHYDFIRSIDSGEPEICRYCILGIERNPTIWQELTQSYLAYKRIGLDE